MFDPTTRLTYKGQPSKCSTYAPIISGPEPLSAVKQTLELGLVTKQISLTVMKIFISHTESDAGWVESQLAPALSNAGLECHHDALFSLGKPRRLDFEEAIKQCERTLLILSPAYFADESLGVIDLLAAQHGEATGSWPVIPVIRQAVELPPRLAILNSLDATDEASWPEALDRLCRELNIDTPSPPPKPDCPYPGLKPFAGDSQFPFYGRQEEVQDVIERLRLHPFLAVIGASGSGKSSLVHAGVIPELSRSQLLGEGKWLIFSFRPGEGRQDQPLINRLEAHLSGRTGDAEPATDPVDSILRWAREGTQPDTQQLLLIIDQFEEVYTLQNERDEELRLTNEQADEFQDALLRLADVPACYVILTVRADFFGDLMESPVWEGGVKEHRFELTTLGVEGMRQAIVQPALDQEVCVSDVLAERLLAEAGSEPGILPFLQETLVLLWDKLQWRYLSVRDYESMVKGRCKKFGSGLEVAMAQRADATIRSLPDDAHRLVARRILLRLIQFGEGRSHTRRQQTVDQLSSTHADKLIFETALTHLTQKRLLTVGHARAGQDASPTQRKIGDDNEFTDDRCSVDIAHDKLITGWPALREWIHERRNAEEKRRMLERKTNEWIRLGRKRFGGGLLDKIELAECDHWVQSDEAVKIGEIHELDQLQKVSRIRMRIQQGLIGAVPILAVTAMGFWIWGVYGIASKESERAKTAEALRSKETQRANVAEVLAHRTSEALSSANKARLITDKWVAETDAVLSVYPWLHGSRNKFLPQALRHYEELSQGTDPDPQFAVEQCEATLGAIRVARLIGDHEKSLNLCGSLISLLGRLQGKVQESERVVLIAKTHIERAHVERAGAAANEFTNSITACDKALTILNGVSKHESATKSHLTLKGKCYLMRGGIHLRLNTWTEAQSDATEAFTIFDLLWKGEDSLENFDLRLKARILLGQSLLANNKPREAMRHLELATAELSSQDDDAIPLESLIPRIALHNELARSYEALGRDDLAATEYSVAAGRFAGLWQQLTDVPTVTLDWIVAHTNQAQTLHQLGRSFEVTEGLEQAASFAEQLALRAEDPQTKYELLKCRDVFGQLLTTRGQYQRALELLQLVVAQCERLPPKPEYRHLLAAARSHLAQALHGASRYSEAQVSFEDAIRELKSMSRDTTVRTTLARVHSRFGVFHTERSQETQAPLAAAHFSDAEKLWIELCESDRVDPHVFHELAQLKVNCPHEDYRKPALALKWATKACQAAPHNSVFRSTKALALYRCTKYQEAKEELALAVPSNAYDEPSRSPSVSPPTAAALLLSGMISWQLGDQQLAREQVRDGLDWYGAHCAGDLETRQLAKEASDLVGVEVRGGASGAEE